MKKAIIYVHGDGGSPDEVKLYEKHFNNYDKIGVDYKSDLPAIASLEIRDAYDSLKSQYDEIILIANSIGAYFSRLGLQNRAIKKAYFISPILDMERLILDMMMWAGVTEAELEEKREISTNFGKTLSWDYLTYVRSHPVSWDVPTSILYAEGDNLTSRDTVDAFVREHNCRLTVMENGEHWFHTEEQLAFLDCWMKKESE